MYSEVYWKVRNGKISLISGKEFAKGFYELKKSAVVSKHPVSNDSIFIKLVDLAGVPVPYANIKYGNTFFTSNLMGEAAFKRDVTNEILISFISDIFKVDLSIPENHLEIILFLDDGKRIFINERKVRIKGKGSSIYFNDIKMSRTR